MLGKALGCVWIMDLGRDLERERENVGDVREHHVNNMFIHLLI